MATAIKVKSASLLRQSSTDREYYASWTAPKHTKFSYSKTDKNGSTKTYSTYADTVTASYYYKFEYTIKLNNGKQKKVTSDWTNTKLRTATFSAPDNAEVIYFSVKPVSKTFKNGKNQTDKSYYSGSSTQRKFNNNNSVPFDLSAASVSIADDGVTAVVTGSCPDNDVMCYVFRCIDNTTSTYLNSKAVNVFQYNNDSASASYALSKGHRYRFNYYVSTAKDGKGTTSGMSVASGIIVPLPARPSISSAACTSATSALVKWDAPVDSEAVDKYTLEYCYDNEKYFTENRTMVKTIDNIKALECPVVEIDSGLMFVRLIAVNGTGESEASKIASVYVGSVPTAPTVSLSSNVVKVGDSVYLSWIHNSQDNSIQQDAKVIVNGKTSTYPTEDDEPVTFVEITTNKKSDGDTISAKVCTKGVMPSYSPYSEVLTANVYDNPTASVTLTADGKDLLSGEVMKKFPLTVGVSSTTASQTPVGFLFTICATRDYEFVGVDGSDTFVASGQTLLSRYVATSSKDFTESFGAGDVILKDGETYKLKVVGTWSSGLRSGEDDEYSFKIDYDSQAVYPLADISEGENGSVVVIPFVPEEEDEPESGAEAEEGDVDLPDNVSYPENYVLSVYRVGSDGELTCIGENIPNTGNYNVVDKHPTLNSQGYRVTAIDTDTGNISFADFDGDFITDSAIVINWDEGSESEETLRLPFNVKVQENTQRDFVHVDYIGRKHPVAYYGTQVGQKATWSCDIPKSYTDTISALRKLAVFQGDVYVREPYGSGYWATIEVDIEISASTYSCPVSISVTRVDHGSEAVNGGAL